MNFKLLLQVSWMQKMTEDQRSGDPIKKIQNFIDGNYTAPRERQYLDNINPAHGTVFSQIPDSDEQDALDAIRSAKEAFVSWKKTSLEERSQILLKMSQILNKRLEEFAQLETTDNGKPLKLSRNIDIPRSVSNLKFFANAIVGLKGESFSETDDVINYTSYSPLGVVICISPWNLPLYLFTWKIAPALAAGNTVVAKPSEITPMTAALLGEVANEAGLPKGVLNIIHGKGSKLGDPLTTHPDVKAISFTGSTKTGEIIARNAAPLFKKISLEMGGKNPNIIFADCNYKKALETTIRSSFANQGQICLCGSRIFVERSLYSKFKNDLIKRVSALKVGNPNSPDTDQGALVSKEHFLKVTSYLEIAKEEGGNILTGGEVVNPDGFEGYFLAPTLIENLDPYCRTNQEEIFGPIATITPFDREDQVIEWANSTRYGLAGSIWTENLSRAHRFSREINSGILWINTWLDRDLRTPFGGTKDSGVGREGGIEALHFFSEVKNTCIRF